MKCHSGLVLFAVAVLFWAVAFTPLVQSGMKRHPRQISTQRLTDGTTVTVVAAGRGEDSHRYQYLPARLSLSQNRNSPEFSFLPYREEDGGPLQGAIMHFLIRWGLTAAQEEELQHIIRKKIDSLGVLEGAVPVRALKERSWEITAKRPIGMALNRGLASSGLIPTNPGHKMAIAFRFDARDAEVVDDMLRGRRGAWGEKIRLFFLFGPGTSGRSEDDEADWVLEADLGVLLPRTGH